MKVLNSRILIKIKNAGTTKSGIILTSTDKIIAEVGTVKEIAEEVTKVKVGDKVLFKSWSLDSIIIEDDTFCFLSEDDIIAII
jgi:co-chaperonin GroES (HSP10)